MNNLANNLTILRILLVPLFVGSLIYYAPERDYLSLTALWIAIVACATDAVDGWVARRLNQKTVVGSYIDPIADKLLLLSGFFSLSFMTHLPDTMRIPAWVAITVITRDVVILMGAIIIFITTGRLKAEPLFIGKSTTAIQMGTMLASLAQFPMPIQMCLFTLTVVLTVISGIRYFRMGSLLLQS